MLPSADLLAATNPMLDDQPERVVFLPIANWRGWWDTWSCHREARGPVITPSLLVWLCTTSLRKSISFGKSLVGRGTLNPVARREIHIGDFTGDGVADHRA